MARWGKSSRRQRCSSVLCTVLLIVQWSCYTSADDPTTTYPPSVIITAVSETVSTVQPNNSPTADITVPPEVTDSTSVTDSPSNSTSAVANTSVTESVTPPEPSPRSPESQSIPSVGGGDDSLQATPPSTPRAATNIAASTAIVKKNDPTTRSSATASAASTQPTAVPNLPSTTTEKKASAAANAASGNKTPESVSQSQKSKPVLITLLVLGCLLGLAMLLTYYCKDKHSWSPKPVRLVEAGRPESDCRGNTAMSDMPNEPSTDGQEKPKLNGENQSTASATGNGHQKKADETDTEV